MTFATATLATTMETNRTLQPSMEEKVDLLRAIAHIDRVKILSHLIKNGSSNVNDLVGSLGIPQSTTSQHLNKLRSVGAVTNKRHGLEIFYSIHSSYVLDIMSTMFAGEVTPEQIEALKSIAHEARIKLLLKIIDEGESNVSPLIDHVGMAQSSVSQHLTKMRSTKVVSTRREKVTIFYRVNHTGIGKILVRLFG
ncbi:metalloregulator ArsR/SmtB family transcription factor [Bacillus bombysepticus]|uniref:ArsR/SmtB family transcription factor n=1 Tax=Bacillus bombysepticus TaxID=658666 RepID=UPI0030192389